jgi:hypothetical protein
MDLPFTEREFFDLFGAYNQAFWPVVAGFWIASAAMTVRLVRGQITSRGLTRLVAAQWAWTGLVYHGLYFTSINPAAWLFAGLFLAEAIALLASDTSSSGSYRWRGTPRDFLAAAFVVYGLTYPILATLDDHDLPRVPLFAVPCPLALFTTGVLLAADARPARWLVVVPIGWSLVGGTAAILLGVVPDLALYAAAAALTSQAVMPAIKRHLAGRELGPVNSPRAGLKGRQS